MILQDVRWRSYLVLAVVAVAALMISLPAVTRAAPLDLPPRPTPLPTQPMPPRPTPGTPNPLPPRPGPAPAPLPSPPPQPPLPSDEVDEAKGAYIELRAQFEGEGWAWAGGSWRDLWVVVQWQDRLNDWHDVVEWQGTLDDYAAGEAWKVWWVAEEDLDTGAFRWVIYRAAGDSPVAQSDVFSLPRSIGERVVTEVSLRP